MDWVEKVNHALNYIEKNLYDEIDYNEIEKIIISPIDVLQRFFMLNTGNTLTEYIRRRKLSEAGKALKNSDEKIIDIALKLGYGSSDAFALAFKRLFGISPSDARAAGAILKPCPRMIFSLSITYIEGETEMKNINEIKPFVEEQEIFIMPDIRIIGVEARCKLSGDDEPPVWDEFMKNGFPSALKDLPRAIPDAVLGWTGECPVGSDSYTLLVSIACPAGTPVPKGYAYRDIPASYVAKGEYGDDIGAVINKFAPHGFITCYTDLGWNAELFFDAEKENPPKTDCFPFWRWLVPCVKVDET
jgi:AraC family transcriptional regulator